MTAPAVPTIELSEVKGSKGMSAAKAATEAMPAAPNQEADAAQAKDFDGHMGVASTESTPGTVHMHRAQEATHGLDATLSRVRTETAALDARYHAMTSQIDHMDALVDSSDPMMSMVRMADFAMQASATMQQYQFSMSMADTANGTTKSLLKDSTQ